MKTQPSSGAAGIPLREITDEQPVVIHGPMQGDGVEQAVRDAEHSAIRLHSTTADPMRELDPGAQPSPAVLAAPVSSLPASEQAATRPSVAESPRAVSLDALRGLFLVVITLSFTIYGTQLPDWMYHRQFPPPFQFVDVPGLTWRDLAYAAFLFTMAAALPISLSRRIERGETEISTMLAIGRRFVLLFMFALLIGHSNTYFIGYTQPNRLLALLGFVLMFAVFVRRRSDWNEGWFKIFNRLAWAAAIAFLVFAPSVYSSTFSPERRDDIMAGLAFAALSGSVVWYFTRHNLGVRLAILAGVAALYMGARGDGWVRDWWWSSPVPWLMRPSTLILLTVVIPGTIAGDLLLRWMRSSAPDESLPHAWSGVRAAGIALLCVALVVVTVVGLDTRQVLVTTRLVLVLCGGGLLLTLNPRKPTEQLVRQLFLWGALWLILGVFLDPAEGGIRKVPDTLSYFFTVTGITMMLLVAFTAMIEILRQSGWARPLVEVGVNPMLAYVMYSVFLNSLLEMIPQVRPILRSSPGESILRSLLVTVLVVVAVQVFTRRRIFWRT